MNRYNRCIISDIFIPFPIEALIGIFDLVIVMKKIVKISELMSEKEGHNQGFLSTWPLKIHEIPRTLSTVDNVGHTQNYDNAS